MKKIMSVLLLLICCAATAQKTGRQLADSLLQVIPAVADDTVKARMYNRVYNELAEINQPEALNSARAGLAHARKMGWSKGIAVFLDNIGRSHSSMGSYDSAVFYYQASLQVNERSGNTPGMTVTYNNLGVAAQNIKADFAAAADYYFKALHLARAEKDSVAQANTLNNLAAVYKLQKNYRKALDFNRQALQLSEILGRKDDIAVSLQNMGKTFLLMKDIPKARSYFQKGLGISEKEGSILGMAMAWSNISLTCGNDYEAILKARIKAGQLWNETNPVHPEAIANLGNLGICYLDIARSNSLPPASSDPFIPAGRPLLLNEAARYLKEAVQLAAQIGDVDNHSFFSGALAEVQEQQGDFRNAYYNYRYFKETEDSLYSQESKNRIAEAESRRAMGLRQVKIDNQRKMLWLLIGSTALVSFIGFLLYRQTRARKKANLQLRSANKALDEANRAKARFFALMSHDLRSPVSRLINFLYLQKKDPRLLTPDLKETFNEKITERAEALLENLETMLLWSKSQMEQFRPLQQDVDISSLMARLRRSFQGDAGIQFRLGKAVQMQLLTDENYLFSILHNLIRNSAEALAGTEAACIECGALREGNTVVFYVQDNGPGFPQSLVNAGAGPASISGRKGLGLYMVQDMAAAIDGDIRFSNNSKGALATLTMRCD